MFKQNINAVWEKIRHIFKDRFNTGQENTRLTAFGHIFKQIGRIGGPVLPAICLGLLVASALYGYQKPEAKPYQVVASDDIVSSDSSASTDDTASETATTEQAAGSFDKEDGVYRGTGTGYGGNVVVDVTIASQTITQIDVVDSSSETASFFEKATGVIDSIIATQSTDVDVVSGATYSSNGIISAVKNALTGEESEGTTAAAATATGSASVSTVEEGEYKDGTYTGQAQGFGGTIKVEVTVKNSKIKKITVLDSSSETASYFNKAKAVINTIIKKQTTNVDTVSGATYSSAGLIKAVRNALSKAEVSSSGKKTSKKNKNKKNKNSSTSTTTETKTETSHSAGEATTGGLPYDDGTYYGTGTGWGGTTKVSVTIKDKAITDITVVSHEDTDSYFEKAKSGLISKVISQQNTNVDVVSGATYSSEGILEAIDNALSAAAAASGNGSGSSDSSSSTTETASGSNTGSSSDSSTESNSESTTASSSDNTSSSDELTYKNGTYSASASCADDQYDNFEYTVTVSLTLENDIITAMDVSTSGNTSDDTWYINRALNGTSKYTSVKTQIMNSSSASGIDAVSGATYTSNAIISAAKSALEQAKN